MRTIIFYITLLFTTDLSALRLEIKDHKDFYLADYFHVCDDITKCKNPNAGWIYNNSVALSFGSLDLLCYFPFEKVSPKNTNHSYVYKVETGQINYNDTASQEEKIDKAKKNCLGALVSSITQNFVREDSNTDTLTICNDCYGTGDGITGTVYADRVTWTSGYDRYDSIEVAPTKTFIRQLFSQRGIDVILKDVEYKLITKNEFWTGAINLIDVYCYANIEGVNPYPKK